MLPFAPLPGRIQAWATGDPPLHQPWALRHQMHSGSPPWSIPGVYDPGASDVAAGAAFSGPMAPPSCPNLPPMMQNNNAGIPPDFRWLHGDMQSLNQDLLGRQHFGLSRDDPRNLHQFQGQLQGPNVYLQPDVSFASKRANNPPKNINSAGALPYVYSLSPQTMTIQENQVGDLNSHSILQPQVYLFEVTARVVEPKSILRYNKNELRCWQKQKFKYYENMKINMERTDEIAVVKKRREGKPQSAMNIQSSLKDSQRWRPIRSTGKKIQQWVKARRKNYYPTKAKTKKQPKVARPAECGFQVPKLRRSKRLKAKALAAAKVDSSEALKITEQIPKKEVEVGVEVPLKHQCSREANNSEVLKVTSNIPNRSNKKRKREGKRPSIGMVQISRELKMKDHFPNKGVREPGHGWELQLHGSKEANISGMLKKTDNIPYKSNKKWRIPRWRKGKARVE